MNASTAMDHPQPTANQDRLQARVGIDEVRAPMPKTLPLRAVRVKTGETEE
jgi:hypothetical protein